MTASKGFFLQLMVSHGQSLRKMKIIPGKENEMDRGNIFFIMRGFEDGETLVFEMRRID